MANRTVVASTPEIERLVDAVPDDYRIAVLSAPRRVVDELAAHCARHPS